MAFAPHLGGRQRSAVHLMALKAASRLGANARKCPLRLGRRRSGPVVLGGKRGPSSLLLKPAVRALTLTVPALVRRPR